MIRWVPGFIRRDFLRKAISVFFAILVWNKVNSQIGEIRVMSDVRPNITVEQGIELIDHDPKEFSLNVRGTSQQLNRVSNVDFKIEVNVPASKASDEKRLVLRIDPYSIKTPGGVRVVQVKPPEITLHLDRNMSKSVPVVAEFRDSGLPQEYAYGEVKLTPPHSHDQRSRESCRRHQVRAHIEDQPRPLHHRELQDRRHGATTRPQGQGYSLDGHRRGGDLPEGTTPWSSRICLSESSRKPGNPMYAKLESGHVSVTLKGSKTALETLDTAKIKVFVDISKFTKPGSYMGKVDCWVNSPNVDVKFIIPSYLDLEIKGEQTRQVTFQGVATHKPNSGFTNGELR